MTFFTGLALLFIGLKLTGIITWAWWLVLLPIMPSIIIFIVFLFSTIMAGILLFLDFIFRIIK